MAIPSSEHLAEPYNALVHDARESIVRNQVVERLWAKDHCLWNLEPTEVANRLGWLTMPEDMFAHVELLKTMAVTSRKKGIRNVVLLGMGAAASAPKSFVRGSVQRRMRRASR